MKSQKEKHVIPSRFKNARKKVLDRRAFLSRMGVLGAGMVVLPLACKVSKPQDRKMTAGRDASVLSKKQWNILKKVTNHLFPSEADAPGAREIRAAAYIQKVFTQKGLDRESQAFLKNGLDWIDEEAQERWGRAFLELNEDEREKLLRYSTSLDWGESWLSAMLIYIFEALLADPIYGCNPDGVGWKWLDYMEGQPHPIGTYEQLYMS